MLSTLRRMIPTAFGKDGRRDRYEEEKLEADLVHLSSAIDDVPIPKNTTTTTRFVYVDAKQEKRRKHSAIQFNQHKEQETSQRTRSFSVTATPTRLAI